MPGFCVSNIQTKNVLLDPGEKSNITDIQMVSDFCVRRSTTPKFIEDKLFNIINDVFVITEGVILNTDELCKSYGIDWLHTVYQMIKENEIYFDSFRGAYSGGHYDISKNKWTFYTGITGDRPVYYYNKDGVLIVASRMSYITDLLIENQISYELDEPAVYDMLTYGFFASEDRTYIKNIKRIPYGCYIEVNHENILTSRYFDFNYCDENTLLSDEMIIEEVDKLFRNAVELQFRKDVKYGYHHLIMLSGGLDSRMVAWIAKDLGFDHILSLNFGQADCVDEEIAKQVSQALHTELVIKNLNDGKFLLNMEKIVELNEGLSLYSALAHGWSALKDINFDRYGILHSGDIGDAILGAFQINKKQSDELPGAYSRFFADKTLTKYRDNTSIEKFMMTTRGFHGVGCSMAAQQTYADTLSPFLNREFLVFCLEKIPFNKRNNHYIYKKWVLSKYSKAALIPVERYQNGLLTDGKLKIQLRKAKSMGIKKVCKWMLWKIHVCKNLEIKEDGGMNPFDLWYSYDYIQENMDRYFYKEIKELLDRRILSDSLERDMELLYTEGTTMEKTQAITAVSAIKLLYGIG